MSIDDRHLRSLGVTQEQFDILLEAFTLLFETLRQRSYQAGLSAGTRKRRPGGSRKGAPPSVRDKLLFVLYYFNMSHSRANENLHRLCPVLHEALVHLKVMPHREFETPDDLMKALKEVDTILIDMTERNHRRPKDDALEREQYSGKKKTYDQKHRNVDP